jgi:cardiolipin synthase
MEVMMRPFLERLPNLLSLTRVGLVPVLWVLALHGETAAVGFGLVVAGLTDVFDGQLARRLDVATPRGAALDSLGDNLLVPSGAIWLVLLRPDVASSFAVPLVIWLTLYAAFIVLGLVKFRRFGNLHLYSSKAAGVLAYGFVTSCFLFQEVPMVLGWLAFAMSVIAVTEGLICQVVCAQIDENVGSLFRLIHRGRSGEAARSPGKGDRVGRAA